jgi:ATP/maltotriose-dependent transcriptional regulator MalT
LRLYLGQLHRLGRSSLLESFYHDIGWEGDRARCQLFLAEAARRQADVQRCHQLVEAASGWILRSGSVEHLCLLHLVRSRAARVHGDHEQVRRAVEEGLHLARQCGLGLYLVELLCAQSEVWRDVGDLHAAEQAARAALQHASAAECQFMWGAALAGHLLGQALLDQQRLREACKFLEKTLSLRCSIGDPGAEATKRLLIMAGR